MGPLKSKEQLINGVYQPVQALSYNLEEVSAIPYERL
jgi:hypothetical protein